MACDRAGLFILGYCFYYYFARSEMSGFMQTAFYFGYMSMVRLAFSASSRLLRAWMPVWLLRCIASLGSHC